jgi:hypothetical protein
MTIIARFTHDTRRIIAVDEAGAALFRCEAIALVDRDMLDLIANDDLRGLARLRLSIMREHERLPDICYPFLRFDGLVFWATLSTKKTDDGHFETTLVYTGEA